MNSRHISLDLCEAAIPIQPTPSGGIGAAEMIKEIVANIKTDKLEILFRMDSGYFDEDIIATIDLLARKIYGNGVPKMLYYREYYQYPSPDMVPCMKVNGGDFILKGYSGGIIIQNTSPVEKMRIILY